MGAHVVTAAEQAAKMLAHFGENGERWLNHDRHPDDPQDCGCLLNVCGMIFPHSDPDAPVEIEMARRVGYEGDSWVRRHNAIARWQDAQTWSTVRRLLESIRDGVPFTEDAP
jgi:hypothetical protein